jgi:hypothetical protein
VWRRQDVEGMIAFSPLIEVSVDATEAA